MAVTQIGGFMLKLYDYWRSSAGYRVRLALNLKGLEYQRTAVNLAANEQRSPAHLTRNPQGLVPVVEIGEIHLTQSMAICEFLDEVFPRTPPLLPRNPDSRAWVRALANLVACEIHPLNNLRVLRYLRDDLRLPELTVSGWYRHWVEQGLGAMEAMITREGLSGRYCFGDTPGLADCFLIPQLYNARRYECELLGCPTLLEIESHCLELPAFRAGRPECQSDAPKGRGA